MATTFVDCYDGGDIAFRYTGNRSVTKSGKACARWDAPGNGVDASMLPDKTVWAAKNYCRSPWLFYSEHAAGTMYPYCSTTENGDGMEACNFPICQGEKKYLFLFITQ